jgi:hypothetical protein
MRTNRDSTMAKAYESGNTKGTKIRIYPDGIQTKYCIKIFE